jgi:hypothetical protein
MMLIVQLRLTSHFLGELRPDHGGIRRFKKDKSGRVFVNQKFWQDQLSLAARNLNFDVDVRGTVNPPPSILSPSVHFYRRVYSQVNVELFESFLKNTIITFDLMIREDLPKCPSLDQLWALWSFTGEHLGLSQFGSKFGFGRFRLETLKAANVENLIQQQMKTTSQGSGQITRLPLESSDAPPACVSPLRTESL